MIIHIEGYPMTRLCIHMARHGPNPFATSALKGAI